tara:strand:- start:843 stop:953 length:111 start_codon:yes stop_codon:yes gene_type:complete
MDATVNYDSNTRLFLLVYSTNNMETAAEEPRKVVLE